MSTHTPGPWSPMWQNSREREYGGGIKLWQTPVQVGEGASAGNVICTVGLGGPGATSGTKEDVEANALLIAASPDMLEAIKAAMRIESLWVPGPNTDEAEGQALSMMRRAFVSAIAKATTIAQEQATDGEGK